MRERATDQVEDARVAIDGRDLRTLGRERPRDRRADPPRRPENHDHVPRQTQIPRSDLLGNRVIRSLGALAAGLLVATADVDHPVASGCLRVFRLAAFPGLAELLGGQSGRRNGLPFARATCLSPCLCPCPDLAGGPALDTVMARRS